MRVAILLVFALALAGCTSEPKDETPAPVTEPGANEIPGETGGQTGGNQTNSPVNGTSDAPAPNQPPAANLTAPAGPHYVGSEILFELTGSDPDGDNITWTIDSDGDGAIDGQGNFPADSSFAFTYVTAGVYDVVLNVTDGNASVESTLSIEILEPVAEGGTEFPLVLSQDILLSCPYCILGPDAGETTCLAVITDDQGLDCAFWEIPADAADHTWTTSGAFLPTVEYHTDCSGSTFIDWEVTGAGKIPVGTGCIIAYDPIDPVITLVLTIE